MSYLSTYPINLPKLCQVLYPRDVCVLSENVAELSRVMGDKLTLCDGSVKVLSAKLARLREIGVLVISGTDTSCVAESQLVEWEFMRRVYEKLRGYM